MEMKYKLVQNFAVFDQFVTSRMKGMVAFDTPGKFNRYFSFYSPNFTP